MYFFILHLSIADILTAFLTLVPEVAHTITFPEFHGGEVICRLVKYTIVLGPYLSSYTLVMMAIDRYQASTYVPIYGRDTFREQDIASCEATKSTFTYSSRTRRRMNFNATVCLNACIP